MPLIPILESKSQNGTQILNYFDITTFTNYNEIKFGKENPLMPP